MTAPSARYDLTGRTALVTGAGGLLGRQHVAALVDAGARVVVSDIGLAQADATIAAVKEIAPAADLVRRYHRRDVARIGCARPARISPAAASPSTSSSTTPRSIPRSPRRRA